MASASGGSFDSLQSRKRRKKKKGGQSQSKELVAGTSTAAVLSKTSISEEIREGNANMPSDSNPRASAGKQQQPSTKASLSSTSKKHEQTSARSAQDSEQSVGEESKSTFDEELEWCITQLQLGLLRKDASKTQKQENERHLRTLNSPKAPLPRKRQLMRSLFGDYRTKMKKQQAQSFPEPQISSVEKETLEASGKFYKESVSHTQPKTHAHTACSAGPGDSAEVVEDLLTHGNRFTEQFSFNFEIDPDS